jgi:hypothetical protein
MSCNHFISSWSPHDSPPLANNDETALAVQVYREEPYSQSEWYLQTADNVKKSLLESGTAKTGRIDSAC